jgi:hypothetical protein
MMSGRMKLLFFLLSLVLLPVISDAQQVNPGDSLIKADSAAIVHQDTTFVAEEEEEEDPGYIPDTLFLKTGDRITGKIMSFEQGRLSIDAQGTGFSSVKWYKIAGISGGSRMFKVQLQEGDIYIGHIYHTPDTGVVMVGMKRIQIVDIIRFFPLEEKWYKGFKGELGGGGSYTKSSDVLRLNAEYNLYYIISRWRIKNDFSYIETVTNNEERSVNLQLNLGAIYSLQKKWVLSEINSFSRNDELGTKARFSIGLGGGNSIVQTERQRLLVLTGIVENSERDIESREFNLNTEWPLSLEHTVYSFSKPNLSSTTSIASFVGITEKGRFRFDASTDITWEFLPDFQLQLTLYYNYDNRELEGKNTQYDYGTVLSLLLELK